MVFTIFKALYFVGCFLALAATVLVIGFTINKFKLLYLNMRLQKSSKKEFALTILKFIVMVFCPVLHYVVAVVCIAECKDIASRAIEQILLKCHQAVDVEGV